jgi:uncharacterized spore protein YtfJ
VQDVDPIREESGMKVVELAERAGELLTVRRVFGEPYERDGVTVIPVAFVRGAAGGGRGERRNAKGGEEEGEGGGLAALVKPAGVYIVADGNVRWAPAVDVNRIVAGGQLLGLAVLLVVRAALGRRSGNRSG